MSTLSDLLHQHTALKPAAVEYLQRLVGEWQLISDLCFADLLLWVDTGDGILCTAQVRPTTAPTVHVDDQIGRRRHAQNDPPSGARTVPVAFEGVVIAELSLQSGRHHDQAAGPLEESYLLSGQELLRMVSAGLFPPTDARDEPMTGPRAGDGLILLDAEGCVRYASPNALSAFRRFGLTADLDGVELAATTRRLVGDSYDGNELAARIRQALSGRSPGRLEVDARGATVLFRLLPLRPPDGPAGVLVLVRDVTDLRRRDRQLLSKDATIREIHHRVKNNLQTVAALLRLQARRTAEPAAKFALQESVRRVASIALVHETLSVSLDESVDFDGIVDRLIPTVTELAGGPRSTVIRRQGSFGVLPAETATPLVVVLTELLHNAAEHAFDAPGGHVVLRPRRAPAWLATVVADDGKGLPPGFSLEGELGLGLQIVRTLVETELGGTITMCAGATGGTEARLNIPLVRR